MSRLLKFIQLCVILLLFLPFSLQAEECVDCHENKDIGKSIHKDLSCTDCHGELAEKHTEKGAPKVDCSQCHEEEQKQWQESVHSATELTGSYSATCTSCHGTHGIISAKDFKTETACVVCHRKPEILRLLGIRGPGPVAGYENSIHNRFRKSKNASKAPNCFDCHGSHTIYRMSDYRSSYNTLNIPTTCGVCHKKEKEEYIQSIHWRAAKRGHYEAPVCNDCHGEHRIDLLDRKTAEKSQMNLSSQVCASCHSSDVMMGRFGLDTRRFESYMKTYHGLASIRGAKNAANCVSCHEVHAIRAQSDPKSSIHANNVINTCDKCHGQVSKEFASTLMHPINLKERNPLAYYVKLIYIVLIIVTVGGMVIHNINEILYYVRKKKVELTSEETTERLSKFAIWQHVLLIISFVLLVITGFALKFPDNLFVQWLNISEYVRHVVHRIAAVVLLTISFIQGFYLFFFKQGRNDLLALIPKFDDVKEMWQSIRFHLGRIKERPKFGRYSYVEKFEYLALIWGTIIMAITGFILWFPEFYMSILPSWTFEVAEVIHFYEAILATLAIIIWHFFFVIFHPEKYPMDLAWIYGRVTKREHELFHPMENTEDEEDDDDEQ
jgi:cytochrome b subunit of formate dehydrogenase